MPALSSFGLYQTSEHPSGPRSYAYPAPLHQLPDPKVLVSFTRYLFHVDATVTPLFPPVPPSCPTLHKTLTLASRLFGVHPLTVATYC